MATIQLHRNTFHRGDEGYYRIGPTVVTQHDGGQQEADAILAAVETHSAAEINGPRREAWASVHVVSGGKKIYHAAKNLIEN